MLYRYRLIISVVMLLANLSVLASTSHIEVHFPGAENQKVTVWTYRDLISLERKVIATTTVDNKGDFSFTTYNSSVQIYYFQLRYFRIGFYIKPNTDYKLEVTKTDFTNRAFYPKTVVGFLTPQFTIVKPSTNELNNELDSVNLILDDFVNKNHLALRLGERSWKLVDGLSAQLKQYTQRHPSPFIKEYVDIQLAQFRMMANLYGNDYIVSTYFMPANIAYNNPAFMSFFNSFWTKYIPSRLSYKIRKRLDSVINKTQSYQALSALLAEDSLLKNPALRELVVLRNIPQMYKSKEFDSKALINILYDISNSKYSKEHQRIAVNLRRQLQKLEAGTKAPGFELIDINSDTLNLSNLAGKYIYIQFWDDDCIECLSQMKYTKELYEQFDDIITFIHISLDKSPKDMMATIANKDYKWHFVYLGDNYNFIQNYNVDVLPRSILIDKEGNFIAWDARLPTQYFKEYFLKMINEKKGNLKVKRSTMLNGRRN